MRRNVMVVVAGPPGSGKSSIFPIAEFGVDSFNVDDRRRELNGDSSRNIPREILGQSNRELKAFVESHIREGRSFAFEATLRHENTLDRAAEARANGFNTRL